MFINSSVIVQDTLPFVIAHRGRTSKSEQESSLPTFEKAIQAGVDYLELDVHKTSDGKLVVNHDARVGGRFFGKKISTHTYDELLKVNPSMPLLQDVISLAKGRVKLDVEIKKKGYEADVVTALKAELPTSDYLVMSFKPDVIKAVELLAPETTTGLLLWAPWSSAKSAAKIGADFVAGMYQTLYKKLSKQAKELGMPFLAWTVNDLNMAARMLKDPLVTGVITDEATAAKALRGIAS